MLSVMFTDFVCVSMSQEKLQFPKKIFGVIVIPEPRYVRGDSFQARPAAVPPHIKYRVRTQALNHIAAIYDAIDAQ